MDRCEEDGVDLILAHFGIAPENREADMQEGQVWSRKDKEQAKKLLENRGPFRGLPVKVSTTTSTAHRSLTAEPTAR